MKIGRALLLIAGGLALYLAFMPTPIEPEAWRPPPRPELVGSLAPNDRLAGGEWRSRTLEAPEAITFDGRGGIVTGLADGRVVRLSTGSDELIELANTGGRPLGLEYDSSGRLIICDAHRGLLALEPDGKIRGLVHQHDGIPFRFTDDLAIASDGTIYFTDASSRFGIEEHEADLLEHRPTGRLLAHQPRTGTTALILGDLSIANGVALGPDESFLAVVETGAYRVHRVWLKGPRRGEHDLLIDALPGFPDNIRFAPSRGVFWLAIPAPRIAIVDALAPHPALRKVVSRLPKALWPAPERVAMVLAIDPEGRIVESLQHADPQAYAPVSSAVERGGWLYMGSYARAGWARVPIR